MRSGPVFFKLFNAIAYGRADYQTAPAVSSTETPVRDLLLS